MRVELTDPSYADDLVAFLRACDCTVEVLAPTVLDVEPQALAVDASLRRPELEIDTYLGIWSALRRSSAAVTTLCT